MSKHTPGPWKASERIKAPGKIDFIRIGREDYDVARVICYGDNAEANAKRIVDCVNACEGINPKAVPELLEALDRFVKYTRVRTMELASLQEYANLTVLVGLADDAIAKAKKNY